MMLKIKSNQDGGLALAAKPRCDLKAERSWVTIIITMVIHPTPWI